MHSILRPIYFIAAGLSIWLAVSACSNTSPMKSLTSSNLASSQDLEADETDVSLPEEERGGSDTDAQQKELIESEIGTTSALAESLDTSTTLKHAVESNHHESEIVRWVAPTADNSVSRNPEITINNFSRLATSDLQSWTEAGTSYINWWHSDITSFIWPIGDEVGGPNDLSHPFNRFQVTLGKDSIKNLKNAYTNWSDSAPCLTGEHPNFGGWQSRYELDEGKKLVLGWMESGADVATAPTPCFSSRAVTYAFPDESTIENGQHTYLHELYHALSSYLQDYCTNGGALDGDRFDKLRWVAEGTAHYFAYVVAAELNGTDDAIETMLRDAERGARGGETLSSAESAAAALRLMVERGDLLEEDIMGARIFETCSWPDNWQISIPSVSYAMNNWQEIESRSGKWVFKNSVLP